MIQIRKLSKFNKNNVTDIAKLVSYLYEYHKFSAKTCASWLRKIVSNKSAHLFTAYDCQNQKIVGIATLISYPVVGGYHKYWIEDVVVSADYQNQGIGRRLVSAALNQAKKEGIEYVALTSRPSRIAANKLYQKMGFEKYETNVYKYKVN